MTKVAYMVSNDDESKILFRSSPPEAGDEWATVERKPEYDQYSNQGYVPPKVLIEDNWWLECHECYQRIDSEYWNYKDDTPIEPIFQGSWIFCCQECWDINAQRREQIKQEKEQWMSFLQNKFPDLSDLILLVGTDKTYAEFKLPGFQYKLSWYSDVPDTTLYSIADEEAAKAYFGRTA